MRIDQAAAHRPGANITSVVAMVGLLAMQAAAGAFAANGVDGEAARSPSITGSAFADVRYMADWVARTRDNGGMPYVIVDKVNATVFVMDANGHLDGTAPALLGMVEGDGSVAGIGDRKMSAIRPEERTTPAGRFVASLGKDLHGQDILWIDYATSIALHRVVKGTPAERRAQRLLSATPDDNRISYGCINVPVQFYEDVIHPAFANSSGVVYILPETSSVRDAYRPATSGAAAGP
jgi:hypothetical protein